MTYKQLIRTFEIISKYDGGLDGICYNMWAEHDEHGISFDYNWNISIEDIRELASFGWLLGSDYETSNEDAEKWDKYENLDDDELKELFHSYNGIYKYE